MVERVLSRKGLARRAEIIETALKVLAERGYRETSLRAIGRELGIEPAHILHYFQSREGLLEEVIRAWDAPVDAKNDAPFLDIWPDVLEHNGTIPGLVHLYTALAAEAATPGHPSHDFFQHRYRRIRRRVVDEVERGTREGRYSPAMSADEIAVILISLSDGLQLQWLIDPTIDPASQLRSAIAGLTQP